MANFKFLAESEISGTTSHTWLGNRINSFPDSIILQSYLRDALQFRKEDGASHCRSMLGLYEESKFVQGSKYRRRHSWQ